MTRKNNTKITHFVSPASMTTIPRRMFSDCSNLSKVELHGNVKKIKPFAFSECKSLTEIIFSEGLEEIHDNSFSYCSKLVSVKFPSSLKWIKCNAFCECENLLSVEFLGSEFSLDIWAFHDCRKLKYLKFSSCKSSTNKLNYIDGRAFEHCESLISLYLPHNDIRIYGNAFSKTNLALLSLPPNFSRIRLATEDTKVVIRHDIDKYGWIGVCEDYNHYNINLQEPSQFDTIVSCGNMWSVADALAIIVTEVVPYLFLN